MKKLLGFLILAGVLLVSCSKEEAQVNQGNFDDKVVVNNNAGDLSSMFTVVDQPIVLNTSGLKATNNPPMLTLKGRFDSPVVNGAILSSSHVYYSASDPNYVYATFHARGEDYAGAVVVFDVSGLGVPTPISMMTFTKTDFNALTIGSIAGQDYIFLAGSNKAWGAIVIKTKLIDGYISQNFDDITYTKLNEGTLNPYAATNVASANSVSFVTRTGLPHYDVFVAAGFTNGAVYRYDAATMILREAQTVMPGAKFTTVIPVDPPKLLALQSGGTANGKVYCYDFDDTTWTLPMVPTATWPMNLGFSINHQYAAGAYDDAGKNTLFLRGDTMYVAAGKSGMKAYDVTTKALLYQAPFDMLSHGNTNGVSADTDYVYMANGEDGLYLGKVETYGPLTSVLSIVGYWDNSNVNGPAGQIASANMVTSTGTYIFVAKGVEAGFGGLAILAKP
ncbi:MAG: hypothetical protein Q7J34_11230 [Bacteroidales bacterium]|nr:hypothetical protein [Bacteroidales bacterium]